MQRRFISVVSTLLIACTVRQGVGVSMSILGPCTALR